MQQQLNVGRIRRRLAKGVAGILQSSKKQVESAIQAPEQSFSGFMARS
jgi:hypothetical protein